MGPVRSFIHSVNKYLLVTHHGQVLGIKGTVGKDARLPQLAVLEVLEECSTLWKPSKKGGGGWRVEDAGGQEELGLMMLTALEAKT